MKRRQRKFPKKIEENPQKRRPNIVQQGASERFWLCICLVSLFLSPMPSDSIPHQASKSHQVWRHKISVSDATRAPMSDVTRAPCLYQKCSKSDSQGLQNHKGSHAWRHKGSMSDVTRASCLTSQGLHAWRHKDSISDVTRALCLTSQGP